MLFLIPAAAPAPAAKHIIRWNETRVHTRTTKHHMHTRKHTHIHPPIHPIETYRLSWERQTWQNEAWRTEGRLWKVGEGIVRNTIWMKGTIIYRMGTHRIGAFFLFFPASFALTQRLCYLGPLTIGPKSICP